MTLQEKVNWLAKNYIIYWNHKTGIRFVKKESTETIK